MTRLSGVVRPHTLLLKFNLLDSADSLRTTAGRDTLRMGFIRPSAPGRLHDMIILPKSAYMIRRSDVQQQSP